MTVIRNHERLAMVKLVLNARGFASLLGEPHESNLRNWAQAVEDVLTRMEMEEGQPTTGAAAPQGSPPATGDDHGQGPTHHGQGTR